MSEANGVAARHSSETAEHYTPAHIVEAARATLGGFDLDPFSCVAANLTVRATRIYDGHPMDGFLMSWDSAGGPSRVFVNPPGGKTANESNQKRAWFKLMRECAARRVTSAIFVCFSVEMLQTTQTKPTGPIPLDFPICYPSKRIAYVRADGQVGASPPHSSCIICVPGEYDRAAADVVARFRKAFAPIGRVVVPQVSL